MENRARHNMRKQIIILLSLLLVGIGFVAWRAAQSNASVSARPTVTFAGRMAGSTNLAVFKLTNTSPRAILVVQVLGEVLIDGKWFNYFVYSSSLPPSSTSQPGVATNVFSRLLEPGVLTSIAVDWPKFRGVWRVRIFYQSEAKGLRAVMLKAREVWLSRNIRGWSARPWGDLEEITSSEISN
ncbi:MAG: hypothetical protein HY043_11305 [Verrucomicrobia bacterium]|nr:hypothetical protein [Verrucomicrobiota bacterium]